MASCLQHALLWKGLLEMSPGVGQLSPLPGEGSSQDSRDPLGSKCPAQGMRYGALSILLNGAQHG